ncbi:DNA polymerase III subunits gamma and tau [Roseivivax halodurans JCM 10272]|uniref:DNA polymerase III subunits gamma and tau n=1 Tax=Roseivivax halodurans JCM 10272 TaxID=1449350 RepID=X7EJY1_9RHOB|nr:SRPBCC family protein [Roseivivax halodurans]ETX15476.1 DNA polymerase III subunits gamma and tau [Roseivivax halodurans JCM 10272]
MRFSVRQEVEGAQDRVFAVLSDHAALERVAREKGVEVTRTDEMDGPAPGMTWEIGFEYRGKTRAATLVLTEYDPPNRLTCNAVSEGLEVAIALDLEALSETRTRVALDMDLSAKTMGSRLLIQPLKVGRGAIEKRLQAHAEDYARQIEARAG